jgi:pimeloyl-ACP methyl ester carboxylesterase
MAAIRFSDLTVRSADGTVIAFERTGHGPAVILVEAAGHYRRFSSFDGLSKLLAADFTVYTYDRRGRGGSSDNLPYAVAREVEDLAALIEEAGGQACLYGFSSGALLVLHAAASGLAIPRLALLEPPLLDDGPPSASSAFTIELAGLVTADRHADAVEFFLTNIGVPVEVIEDTRGTPAWSAMESVAPTLLYDCAISDSTPLALLGSVVAPTLVLYSEGSTGDLTSWAAMVADRLPDGYHRGLAGQWHGVPDDTLAPVLSDFFRGAAA